MASDYPFYAPEFRIKINGEALPSPVRAAVTSVTYHDGVNASDRVEVGIANPNLSFLQKHIRGLGIQPFPTALAVGVGGSGSATSAASGVFDIDNKFSLELGYAPDDFSEVFKGEVTGLQASFPNGGMPSLNLVAHDYLNRLTRGSYARGFGPLHDFLVAAILSAENRLIPLIDPALVTVSAAMTAINVIFKGTGTKQGKRGQGESDLEMLTRIAKSYDADFWVEGDVLYIARFFPKEYSASNTLVYGESLLDFTPQMSNVGQVAAVSMKFTLRELRLSFLVTAGWDFDREALTVSIVPGSAASFAKAASGPAITIVDQPIASPGDIVNSAFIILRQLRTKLNQRLTGTGSAIGNPKLRAGSVVHLDGLGPDFSGNWRISSTVHSIDTGGVYRTRFNVFKEVIP